MEGLHGPLQPQKSAEESGILVTHLGLLPFGQKAPVAFSPALRTGTGVTQMRWAPVGTYSTHLHALLAPRGHHAHRVGSGRGGKCGVLTRTVGQQWDCGWKVTWGYTNILPLLNSRKPNGSEEDVEEALALGEVGETARRYQPPGTMDLNSKIMKILHLGTLCEICSWQDLMEERTWSQQLQFYCQPSGVTVASVVSASQGQGSPRRERLHTGGPCRKDPDLVRGAGCVVALASPRFMSHPLRPCLMALWYAGQLLK
ncbi:hypothetical protein GW7_19825 [Heterocephalus glaber]|uniref:Uncharacterized protein n=1 Tax=Heterocephalus glaber TaxID=10181 RepID=G5BLQ0_HETGA|nr:hypothetical protein GW7_19825 [Heterocephalus glaber]